MIFEDTPNPNAKKINTDHPYALSVYLSNEDINFVCAKLYF